MRLAIPPQRSMIWAMGLSRSSVQRARIRDRICLRVGKMRLMTKRNYPLVFLSLHPMTTHFRWLYSLFIAIDANFRLKLKSRGIKDPELGSGLAYFVNAAKFEAHLGHHHDEGNVSCFYFFCCAAESSMFEHHTAIDRVLWHGVPRRKPS